jgi:hypothetical protein
MLLRKNKKIVQYKRKLRNLCLSQRTRNEDLVKIIKKEKQRAQIV